MDAQPDLSVLEKMKLSKADIVNMLTTYLITHSSRKYNYMYWYVNTTAAPILCFSNLPDQKIERINDPKLCFRLVKVQNRKAWKVISTLINTIFLQNADKRSIHIIRIDYLFQYLKYVKFDLTAIDYTTNKYGTRIVKINAAKNSAIPKSKPVIHMVYDIHCQYLMDKLYHTYLPYLDANVGEPDDIKELFFSESKDFCYVTMDGKLSIPLKDGLDIVSTKLMKQFEKDGTTWHLEQLKMSGDVFNVINRFRSSDITVLSIKVYMHYFLKVLQSNAKKKRKREKNDG